MPTSARRAMSTRVTSAPAVPANDRSAHARTPMRSCHMRRIVAPGAGDSDCRDRTGRKEKAGPALGRSRLSRTHTNPDAAVGLVHDHAAVAVPDCIRLPVLVENRPERLIEILAVLEERLAEQPFLDGADFSQRAVPAPVLHGRPSFQPMHANGVE